MAREGCNGLFAGWNRHTPVGPRLKSPRKLPHPRRSQVSHSARRVNSSMCCPIVDHHGTLLKVKMTVVKLHDCH
jgi:hypothetical protein